MNARQKAKKYKRMYEELLCGYGDAYEEVCRKFPNPTEFKVARDKIDRLRVERYYHKCLYTENNIEYFRHCIVNDIAHDLAAGLDKYIDYHAEFCPHANMYRICGEIKVVNIEGKG